MPRKESGMWYEVHRTPIKGEDGQNIVYVRPKSGMKLNMKQLEDYCERMNYLRYGELSRVMDAFVRAAGRFLAEGYRIDTPIGSFAPKLSLAKQLTDADLVKDRDVHEGPHQFRMEWKPAPLVAGMTITDEPGVYLEGKFGVRIEKPYLLPHT